MKALLKLITEGNKQQVHDVFRLDILSLKYRRGPRYEKPTGEKRTDVEDKNFDFSGE